jgi:hypothetical protein
MATFGTWVFTGAHVGWTQTSKTSIQRDEITGIDFPVRRAAFVAGVEVLVTGTAAAGVLIAMGAFTQRRHVRHAHAQVRQA